MGSTSRIGPAAIAKIEAAWPMLLDAMAQGHNIASACKSAGFDPVSLSVYRRLNPERDAEWQAAREQFAEACIDKIIETASSDTVDSARARVRIDALRWIAGKYNAKAYGDKAQLDVNVKHIDMTAILLEANKRLAAQRTIEGEVVRDALPSELL